MTNTNTTIKEKKNELLEKLDSIEFLHGVPVSLPIDTRKEVESLLDEIVAVVQTQTKAQTLREVADKIEKLNKAYQGNDEWSTGLRQGLQMLSVNRVHEEKSEEQHATNGNLHPKKEHSTNE